MSIASEISALTDNLSTIFNQIKTALTGKGVSGLPADYSEVPAKINSIVTGSGIDTSDATATAADIRRSKTAYAQGSKVTGTLDPGIDTSDANATAANIRLNKTAYVNGQKITGTMPTVTKSNPSITVSNTGKITATYSQDTSGYVASGSTSAETNLSTKSAATYYPSTSDQTIASGKYLTGNQTIKAVTTTNLTAANIKQGVTVKVGDASNSGRVASITGSYVGVGDIDDLVTHATMNATNSGGALVFNIPSGTTIAGMYISRANAASGTIQELLILSSAGSPSTVVICQKSGSSTISTFNDSGNAYYHVFQSGDDPTVSNVDVYVDSSTTGGFDVGTYKAIPFFME